jgi:hypothetical protein
VRRATEEDIALLRARVTGEASMEPAADVAEALLRVTLYGDTGGLQWHSLALLARSALAELREDAVSWDRAAFARDVVRRHLGESVLLGWPQGEAWFESLDADDRCTAWAHVVQSAADADLEFAKEYAQHAAAKLAGMDRSDCALRLRGAVGRALAAIGDYVAAALHLEEAVDGWFALGRVDGISYPMCELLRLRGIARDRPAIERLRVRIEQFRMSAADPVSLVFVRLALGRALVQAGASTEGIAELALRDREWTTAPAHATAARLRWLHYAALQRGDPSGNEHRVALERHASSAQLPLACIDAALMRGEVLAPLVHDLLALIPEGAEAARMLARIAPQLPSVARPADRPTVARMAWEYRY